MLRVRKGRNSRKSFPQSLSMADAVVSYLLRIFGRGISQRCGSLCATCTLRQCGRVGGCMYWKLSTISTLLNLLCKLTKTLTFREFLRMRVCSCVWKLSKVISVVSVSSRFSTELTFGKLLIA